MKTYGLALIFALISNVLWAANGTISGKIVDEKGEALIGATIIIEGTTTGAKTDMDGKFTIRNVEDGKYNLVASYISYEKKTLTDVIVKGGQTEYMIITLQQSGKGLKEVVVKAQIKKETINALMVQQKNLSTISDGISAELIKKTPDRNTGDVLKRVSGVTIADNKFAVIRGLADRYNIAMLNGDILPSSEADRKAFSFDIFPSSLLENIVIIKAATPDRPGEFAGGIIDMSTKDIPNENFLNIQLGSGMNTISTFKAYQDSKNSATDWLGFDKSLRTIPKDFPTTEQMQQSSSQFPLADRIEATKKFSNTWGTKQMASMMPFSNFQVGAGYVKRFKKEQTFGVTAALSYNRRQRTFEIDRNEVNGNAVAYDFEDRQYRDNVLVGSLLNFGYKINNNHKINFKNTFTINADDQTVIRRGDFTDNEYLLRGSALWYNNNQLLSNQLNSEHILTKRKMKLQLGVGRNAVTRTIPDLRRTAYTRNYDAADSNYVASISTFPNPFFMGRFFAETKEYIYNGNADLSIPYKLFNSNHTLKVGMYLQEKSREYNARILAYIRARQSNFDQSLLTLPEDQLFSVENIKQSGFVMAEATLPTDQYKAKSSLQALYLMNDNLLGEKFRLVYGVRVENFKQEVVTGILKAGDKVISKENLNFLPSMNFTYLLNSKTNIRLCASQTLSRPEFRELSPAAFYDYNLLANFRGSEFLEQTTIQNYDLRYEYFMGKGEMVSASVFMKNFQNPIELYVPKGLTTTQKIFTYVNAAEASLLGAEVEFRKSLSFLTSKEESTWNNLVVFGNFAYIKSSVNVTDSTASGEVSSYVRPMQGQSPYIINGGVSYNYPKADLSFTAVFNRIGERIFAVGNGEIPELFEAPRNVLDLALSKKFFKKMEAKLTISDVFSNPQVFYYNIDNKYQIVTEGRGRYSYQNGKDFDIIRTRLGTNIGISLSYQIK